MQSVYIVESDESYRNINKLRRLSDFLVKNGLNPNKTIAINISIEKISHKDIGVGFDSPDAFFVIWNGKCRKTMKFMAYARRNNIPLGVMKYDEW